MGLIPTNFESIRMRILRLQRVCDANRRLCSETVCLAFPEGDTVIKFQFFVILGCGLLNTTFNLESKGITIYWSFVWLHLY